MEEKVSRVLVADDDAGIRRVVERLFSRERESCEVLTAEDGAQALAVAQRSRPDLILLDVCMPDKNGLSVLQELRANRETSLTPVIMVSADDDPLTKIGGLDLGADDYLSKPFDPEELLARARRLLRRVRQDLAANPLTRLPGNPAIEEEVNRRIRLREPFAFFHVDIDRFKSYNDRYGFARGDLLIRATGDVLAESLRDAGDGGFLGHIGGDDFAVITSPDEAAFVAFRAAKTFDLLAPSFYSAEDQKRGFVEVCDRSGQRVRLPIVTLSMGIVTTQQRRLEHYGRVVEIASEMKAYLKADRQGRRSRFAFDRRRDGAGREGA